MSAGVDALLDLARQRYRRLTPVEAYQAGVGGALLVDIRPVAQRTRHGEVPGALVIDRNVLEWRLDPASEARLPVANSYDRLIIVLCQEGYSSSLAAATLLDIGLRRVTDVIGGFDAWCDCGLPITRPKS